MNKTILAVALMVVAPAAPAVEHTLGVEVSYTHFMDDNIPAFYGGFGSGNLGYRAEVEVHGSLGRVLFQLAPVMQGGRSISDAPSRGELYACAGFDTEGLLPRDVSWLLPSIVSVCHHSAHNMDMVGQYFSTSNGSVVEPSVNANYIRGVWRFGSRRNFDLMGDE